MTQLTKFKIGDEVQVVKRVDDQDGWSNSWNHSGHIKNMSAYIDNGKTYTVKSVSMTGIRFKEDDYFGWPSDALQLVVPKYIDGVAVSTDEFTRRTAAPKEMTLAEIAAALGYAVVVKGE